MTPKSYGMFVLFWLFCGMTMSFPLVWLTHVHTLQTPTCKFMKPLDSDTCNSPASVHSNSLDRSPDPQRWVFQSISKICHTHKLTDAQRPTDTHIGALQANFTEDHIIVTNLWFGALQWMNFATSAASVKFMPTNTPTTQEERVHPSLHPHPTTTTTTRINLEIEVFSAKFWN